MKWEHKCSLDWLQARQGHLTASDVRRLLPVTATGRKRTITDEDRLKVYANKMTILTEEDCWSYGAAARGHLLEPYAIDAVNSLGIKSRIGERFYHWDDQIVCSPDPNRVLAFSPDAMDYPQGTHTGLLATEIIEVKSYSAEKHLAISVMPKEKIEERWQIACAMAVSNNIDEGWLLLFNPSLRSRRIAMINYQRHELKDEISTVYEIERDWIDFLDRVDDEMIKASAITSSACDTESAIMAVIEMQQRLNPQ